MHGGFGPRRFLRRLRTRFVRRLHSRFPHPKNPSSDPVSKANFTTALEAEAAF